MSGTGLAAGLAEGIWQQRQFAHDAAMAHAQQIWQQQQLKQQQIEARNKAIHDEYMEQVAQQNADTRSDYDTGRLGLQVNALGVKVDEFGKALAVRQENADTNRERADNQGRNIQSEIANRTATQALAAAMFPHKAKSLDATADAALAGVGLKKSDANLASERAKTQATQRDEMRQKIKQSVAQTANTIQQTARSKALTPYDQKLKLAQSHASEAASELSAAKKRLDEMELEHEHKFGEKMPTGKASKETQDYYEGKIKTVTDDYAKFKNQSIKAKADFNKFKNDIFKVNRTLMGASIDPDNPGKTLHHHERVNEDIFPVPDPTKDNGATVTVAVARAMKRTFEAQMTASQERYQLSHSVAEQHHKFLDRLHKESQAAGQQLSIDGKPTNTKLSPHREPHVEPSIPEQVSRETSRLPGMKPKPAGERTIGGTFTSDGKNYTLSQVKSMDTATLSRVFNTPERKAQLRRWYQKNKQ